MDTCEILVKIKTYDGITFPETCEIRMRIPAQAARLIVKDWNSDSYYRRTGIAAIDFAANQSVDVSLATDIGVANMVGIHKVNDRGENIRAKYVEVEEKES